MFNKKLALARTSLSDAAPRTDRTTGVGVIGGIGCIGCIGGGVVVVVYAGAAEACAWAKRAPYAYKLNLLFN
jgi:hypothetical protein